MILENFHQIYNLTYSNKSIHRDYLLVICRREGREEITRVIIELGCLAHVPFEKITEMLDFIEKIGVWRESEEPQGCTCRVCV